MTLFVGDLCPKCGWILTWLDFGYGRCGHCLNADVPLRRDLPEEFAAVLATTRETAASGS